MTLRTIWLVLLISLLSGCTTATPDPTPLQTPPTMPPSPTVTSTAFVTATYAPFTTLTPAIVLENTSPTPEPTPFNLPFQPPLEKVSILQPGPGSHVTSSFLVYGRAGPTWNGEVHIHLIGEEGRLITEKVTYLLANPGNVGLFSTRLDFDIELVAEAARLEIHNFSRRDGVMDHMASVDIILIGVGSSRIHPAMLGPEKISIASPREDETISGGKVLVSGIGWTEANVPLQIEVHNQAGEPIGSGQVFIQSPGLGQMGTFEVEIPYETDISQAGRIVVYEPSPDIPGMIHYSSVYLYLEP